MLELHYPKPETCVKVQILFGTLTVVSISHHHSREKHSEKLT